MILYAGTGNNWYVVAMPIDPTVVDLSRSALPGELSETFLHVDHLLEGALLQQWEKTLRDHVNTGYVDVKGRFKIVPESRVRRETRKTSKSQNTWPQFHPLSRA